MVFWFRCFVLALIIYIDFLVRMFFGSEFFWFKCFLVPSFLVQMFFGSMFLACMHGCDVFAVAPKCFLFAPYEMHVPYIYISHMERNMDLCICTLVYSEYIFLFINIQIYLFIIYVFIFAICSHVICTEGSCFSEPCKCGFLIAKVCMISSRCVFIYIYMGFLRGTLLKGNYIIQTFEIKNPHSNGLYKCIL